MRAPSRDGVRARCTGALAAWLTLAVACRDAERPGPQLCRPGWDPRTAWVAADRDGSALVELDGDLLVLARRELECPLWVRAGGGQTWVVHAPAGAPTPPFALRVWGAAGAGPAAAVGETLGMEVDAQGRALVLVRDGAGASALERYGSSGLVCDMGAPPESAALALGPRGPAVALGVAGWAELLPDGGWRRNAGFEGACVLDLAPRAEGGWWILVRLPGETDAWRVAVNGEGLPLELQPVGDARRLARRCAAPWAWSTGAREVRGPGPSGARGVSLHHAGAGAAVGDAHGGLVVAAAGALLRLAPSGAASPGQGGFMRLTDLERLEP